MPKGNVGTREEWIAAREELLHREKEHTRMGDELARQRRELPWVPVDKQYRFETDEGTRTLPDLFEGRSQLLVYHFMFGPAYEAGCPTCSSSADAVNGVLPHLQRVKRRCSTSPARRSRRSRHTSDGWAGAFRGSRRAE